MTIPAPMVTEIPARRVDARTTEVLRSLHRAKETIASTRTPIGSSAIAPCVAESSAGREHWSSPVPVTVDTSERLAERVLGFERAIAVNSGTLAELQRSQESASKELRDCMQALRGQADVVAAWRSWWWTRQAVAWGVLLMLLFVGGAALAWRAYVLAQDTHDVLAQILENQTKAQAVRSGKRK